MGDDGTKGPRGRGRRDERPETARGAPSEVPSAARGRPDLIETPTEELARLLDEAEGHRVRALPFDPLRRLARLYRGESARLARLRDRGGDLDRIGHLNSLCVRAHGFLYSASARQRRRVRPVRLVIEGFAATRELRGVAWGLLAAGALIGLSLVRLDPSALYALMPTGLGYDATQIDALVRSPEVRDAFFARESTPVAHNALFGSQLFAHNTRVGLLALASGLLAGLPTVLLQLYNGIVLGAFAGIFLGGEHTIVFLAWILPHGVPELTAIHLCGAGGLALGRAVVAPGRMPRRRALQQAGSEALALLLASVALFFVAAWIESFVRESTLGTAARLAVAAGGIALLLGLGHALRRAARIPRARSVDWIDRLLEGPGVGAIGAEPDGRAPRAQRAP